MKATKLSALAALMLMVPVAQQAHALSPTTVFNDALTTDVVLNISGSSALQPVIGDFVNSVCDTATLDTYKDVTGTTIGGNWRSYSCNLNAATITANGLPAGAKMLLNNRNKGGSVYGVTPIQRQLAVAYMNINNSNCTETPAGSKAWNCTVTALAPEVSATTGECDSNTVTAGVAGAGSVFCKKSTAGISDVEPGMFVPPNLPSTAFAAGTPAAVTTTPELGVIFGILVTEHLYRDLQTVQGLVTYTNTDPLLAPTDWTDAKRPSMKKTEIASILKGDFQNWRDVNQGYTTAGTSAGFSGAMAVCRRAPGSGTQAGANAYFMENMCRASSQRAGALSMVTGTNLGGYQVVENSSTGSLLTCLNSAYNATDIAGGVPSGATFYGVTHDAIGFAGIDILPGRPIHTGATPDHFDFVKLDGVAPTVDTAINGDYTFWYENTVNTSSTAPASSAAMLNALKSKLGNPGTLLGGVAALPSASRLWDAPANYPTMRGTRKGNSCQDIILTKDNP
jgi:ABC-type phosphate transport system substrate-binding protein